MELAKITNKYCCGVDLHDKNMYLCVMKRDGEILQHRRIKNNFEVFKGSVKKYISDMAVGVESTHNYYWFYDACRKEGIPFYLGHAYYLRAIRGKKKKDDKIDSKTLGDLMRTNFFPIGYPYPAEKRAARDLLRRRCKLVQLRTGLYNHIHLIHSQQGVIDLELSDLKSKEDRKVLLGNFREEEIKLTLQSDLNMIDHLDKEIKQIEQRLKEKVKSDDKQLYKLLLSYPGIGEIISMIILYEIEKIERFEKVQKFSSYCRVVKTQRESNKKRTDNKNQKIGNPYLKWAFSEASIYSVKYSPEIKKYFENLSKRMCKKKARAVLRHKIAVAVYYTLRNKEPFNLEKFLQRPNIKEKAA
ncbi:MAG: IS110 family transposase [Ignavibacteriaceae bacterium]|jgi:transposase